MEKDTLKYRSDIALRNYANVFALMILSVVVLKISGESTEMIMLKIPLVPLGFLAWKGIYSLYVKPIYEHKVTFRAFECSVLQALVSSLVIVMFLWQPEKSAIDLAKEYSFTFAWFLLLHMVLMIVQVYINSKKHNSSV